MAAKINEKQGSLEKVSIEADHHGATLKYTDPSRH